MAHHFPVEQGGRWLPVDFAEDDYTQVRAWCCTINLWPVGTPEEIALLVQAPPGRNVSILTLNPGLRQAERVVAAVHRRDILAHSIQDTASATYAVVGVEVATTGMVHL